MICLQNVDAWPYHSLPFLQELKRQAPVKICNSKAERAANQCVTSRTIAVSHGSRFGQLFLGPIFRQIFGAFNDPFPTIARMFSRTKSSLELWKHCRLSCTTLPKFVNLFEAKKSTVIFAQACSARLWEMQLPFSRSSRRSLMAYSRWILQFWASLGCEFSRGKWPSQLFCSLLHFFAHEFWSAFWWAVFGKSSYGQVLVS